MPAAFCVMFKEDLVLVLLNNHASNMKHHMSADHVHGRSCHAHPIKLSKACWRISVGADIMLCLLQLLLNIYSSCDEMKACLQSCR